MKYFFLSLFLLLFSSCQSSQIEIIEYQEDIAQKELSEQYSGIIQAKAASLENKATHTIQTDDNNLLEIQSKEIPLFLYEGKQVEVVGVRNKDNILEVENIKEKKEEEENSIEIQAEEKSNIFSAPGIQFSFQYPSNWKTKLIGKVIFIEENKENIIKITRLDNAKNRELTAFTNENTSEITINNQVALRVNTPEHFEIFFAGNKEIIKISRLKDFESTTEEKVFYQFLESFIFSPSEETLSCGGSENILCPEGFRCELGRGSTGVCINILEDNKQENKISLHTEEKKIDIFENILPLEGSVYVNTYMNYSIHYPLQWWYRSFGSTEKSLWHTEFSEKEIENIGEGSIIISVKNGARGIVLEHNEQTTSILLPRDSNSHFEIQGPTDQENILKSMAVSLKQTVK